jgi:hypothetical protein
VRHAPNYLGPDETKSSAFVHEGRYGDCTVHVRQGQCDPPRRSLLEVLGSGFDGRCDRAYVKCPIYSRMGSSVHWRHASEGKGGSASEPCLTMTAYATSLLVCATTAAAIASVALDNTMRQTVRTSAAASDDAGCPGRRAVVRVTFSGSLLGGRGTSYGFSPSTPYTMEATQIVFKASVPPCHRSIT